MTSQMTAAEVIAEGTEIVTVARDGTRTAGVRGTRMSFSIYCTAIYRAVRRERDGVLTWRRVGSLRDGTAGRGVTGPMRERAERYATQTGRRFEYGIRHGMTARQGI
jgi:hypothetical protein